MENGRDNGRRNLWKMKERMVTPLDGWKPPR